MLPLEGHISYTPITFYSQKMTLFYLLDFIVKRKVIKHSKIYIGWEYVVKINSSFRK